MAAAWPLVLIALVMRLAFAGMSPDDAQQRDAVANLSLLSVMCDSADLGWPGQTGEHHHRGVPLEDSALALEDAAEMPLLPGAVLHAVLATSEFVPVRFWVFPPLRGPPRDSGSPATPQGPPARS